jgi:carbamoyl-phosphate synthase large subunit
MRIVRGPKELEIHEPSLVDEFLGGAIELDVDVLADGESAWVAGILEHVEPAGVHSGDSACVIPGPSVTAELEEKIRSLAADLARRLGVRGLLNLQLALADGDLYVIEANPRASRTVPFVAKATGVPLVDHACRLMLGASLDELRLPERPRPTRAWAKEAIFPEDRFPGAADRAPEMRSTGEVMAGGATAVEAYQRALRAAGRSKAYGRGEVGPSLQELTRSTA